MLLINGPRRPVHPARRPAGIRQKEALHGFTPQFSEKSYARLRPGERPVGLLALSAACFLVLPGLAGLSAGSFHGLPALSAGPFVPGSVPAAGDGDFIRWVDLTYPRRFWSGLPLGCGHLPGGAPHKLGGASGLPGSEVRRGFFPLQSGGYGRGGSPPAGRGVHGRHRLRHEILPLLSGSLRGGVKRPAGALRDGDRPGGRPGFCPPHRRKRPPHPGRPGCLGQQVRAEGILPHRLRLPLQRI